MSEKIWSDEAWDDYLYWQLQDKKTLKRINLLIKDIERNGCLDGIGNPEALRGDLQGEYSRRIDEKNRLIWKTGEFSLQLAVDTMAINKFLLFSADNAIFDMLFLTMERAVSFAF